MSKKKETKAVEKQRINPSYYQGENFESIDVIEQLLDNDFCLGNALKYLVRFTIKDQSEADSIKDLQKALWYIERKIKSSS